MHKAQPRIKVWKLKKQEVRKAYLEKLQERDIDIEDSVRVEEQWDKVEKAMTEVAATVKKANADRGRPGGGVMR